MKKKKNYSIYSLIECLRLRIVNDFVRIKVGKCTRNLYSSVYCGSKICMQLGTYGINMLDIWNSVHVFKLK